LYCKACNEKYKLQRERELLTELAREARIVEEEYRKYKKGYDAARQQRFRTHKRLEFVKARTRKKGKKNVTK
jgi:hypothetical protein